MAIIAILTAVLSVTFGKSRQNARAASCLASTKQLALAVMEYTQDYDETYPNGTYEHGSIGGWAGQIYPYAKETALFRCPDDTSIVAPTDKPTSYGMNSNFGVRGHLVDGVPNVAVGLKELTSAKKTILLFEVAGNSLIDVSTPMEGPYPKNYSSSPFGNGSISGWSPSGGGTFDSCSTPHPKEDLKFATGYMGGRDPGAFACHYTGKEGRHLGGSNYLLADGHAQWFRGAQVSSGFNSGYANLTQGTINAAGTSGKFANGTAPKVTFSIQ